jgi:hypothetical protein
VVVVFPQNTPYIAEVGLAAVLPMGYTARIINPLFLEAFYE